MIVTESWARDRAALRGGRGQTSLALGLLALLLIGCASGAVVPTAPSPGVVIDRDAPDQQGEPWNVTIALDDGRVGVLQVDAQVWTQLPPGLRVQLTLRGDGTWRLEWGPDVGRRKTTPPPASET